MLGKQKVETGNNPQNDKNQEEYPRTSSFINFMRFLSYVMVPFRPRYCRIFNVKFLLHFAGEKEFRFAFESSENIVDE